MVSKQKLRYRCLVALLLALCWVPVQGAVVTLKIRAINPSKTEKQKVPVKAHLPRGVQPADVVNSGELDVSYDVSTRTYVVSKEIELAPSDARTFDVTLRDIWVIPEATIKELSGHAQKMSAALKGTDKAGTATGCKELIDGGLKEILARQEAATVGAVKPVDHIRVYESNMESLERVRKDVGVLENLVIAAGKDLDSILGTPKMLPPPDSGDSSATGAVVTLHIKITNPSLTEKKKVPLRHEFPAEIKPTDVVDAAGLQIGFDASRNICYAYLEDLELAPQESRVFDVKIKDPWAGLTGKFPRIEKRCRDILAITKDMETYKAVDAQDRTILKDLEVVKGQKGPDRVNQDYVAFSRQQATQVHELEARTQRLEEFFQPHEQPIKNGIPVMDVPRPDKQTTWILIYIILGFLGVFSALFFLRWYGKSKSETLGQSDQPAGDKK